MDQQDNFYFAGAFGSLGVQIEDISLTNRSGPGEGSIFPPDGFIAKFSRTGSLSWVRQIGGNESDLAVSCAIDASGDVFVTGSFDSTNLVLGGTVLTNPSLQSTQCFLAKYDRQGNLLWARQSSGSNFLGTGRSVAVGISGDVWLAGDFTSSNGIFGSQVLVNSNYDASHFTNQDFLVKYSGDGDVLWARVITVNNTYQPFPLVKSEAGGNAFFCDGFIGVADLGTIKVAGTLPYFQSLLLAQIDPDGNVLWAEEAAHSTNGGAIYPGGLAVDLQQCCWIVGTYEYSAVFPSNTPTMPFVQENAYLAKFDASGNFLWADAPPGQSGGNVTLDAVGNGYAVGAGFISKYAGDGTLLWNTNSLGLQDLVLGAADPAGNLFIIGGTGLVEKSFSAAQLSGPFLNIQTSSNQVVISWPTNEVGLRLGSASRLSGVWSPVTNPPPAIIGNQYFVTNGISAGSQFFRLGNF